MAALWDAFVFYALEHLDSGNQTPLQNGPDRNPLNSIDFATGVSPWSSFRPIIAYCPSRPSRGESSATGAAANSNISPLSQGWMDAAGMSWIKQEGRSGEGLKGWLTIAWTAV